MSSDVLEVACGTGRVALQLAQAGVRAGLFSSPRLALQPLRSRSTATDLSQRRLALHLLQRFPTARPRELNDPGVRVTGLDISAEKLAVAQEKSAGIPNVRWVQGDMRAFALDQQFHLAIIPGHSFQFMLTPEDQIACLACIKRHLAPRGTLVVHLDHQDLAWLGSLPAAGKGKFEGAGQAIHPGTGTLIRISHAWTFERSSQTATVTTMWEETDAEQRVVERWVREPMALHCVFRFEMEHLVRRAGLEVDKVYGDFFRNELSDAAGQMVWVLRNP
jgi:ubiquinone/menaquinone biosynthesis C-methylase UbiE